ncbi:MAG: CehA/McbA family metallohydrolase [Phycisphaeraceae bacterium]
MSERKVARLQLEVKDHAGRPSPFRAELIRAGKVIQRRWSDSGSCVIDTDAGSASVLVRRGLDHDAVAADLNLDTGTTVHTVTLRRRFDAAALGWYAGEAHMHVLHGKNDPPSSIADGGRMAAADGLDYLLLAYYWDDTFGWLPEAELDRRCRQASRPGVTIGWNVETPKCYMNKDDGGRSGNLHCYGHGWTLGLKDISKGPAFFHAGPAYQVIQEVHRQGGIVGCAHPVRSSFAYGGNFVSNWASELPFDFVAGVGYDAIDVLNDSPLLFFQSENLWYTLLNMGYRVAATGNTDGALGATAAVGRYRTYTKIDGAFSWDAVARGVRAGRTVATSGPMALFQVDGQDVGAELPADGKRRRATIQAWSGPLPGETIQAVQLVRNGQIVRAWDLALEKPREWNTSLEIGEDRFAWYSVRVISASGDPHSVWLWGEHLYELAVTSAVYFLPQGFERPQPAQARVWVQALDPAGDPIAAEVAVHDNAALVARHALGRAGAELVMPATASVVIAAQGFEPQQRVLFVDCPELFNYSRNIGMVWPSFYSPETYDELRRRLDHLKLTVTLQRQA